jgi:CubicO group peptidase (beta-lactamase class C family)
MDGFITSRTVAGGITLAVRRGRIAHLKCHGLADAEQQKPMTEDAIFRIYSMTKPITAVAVLTLYEECRFFLDDPLKKYLPEYEQTRVRSHRPDEPELLMPPRRDITIHDVLTHTAGFTYDVVHDAENLGLNLAGFSQKFATVPLSHHPGIRWQYSASHDVLGRLIEVVSGQPFDTFLQERIFDPLGMVDTGFYVPGKKQDRLAAIYELDENLHLIPKKKEDRPYLRKPKFLSGGGGLVSTTADYLRFCLMLLNNGELEGRRTLGRKTVDLMRVDHLPPGHPGIAPYKFGYGLGVSVVRSLAEKQGMASVGEYGWGGAANTDLWIDPAEDMITMIMMQLKHPKPLGLTKKVKDAFYQAIVD